MDRTSEKYEKLLDLYSKIWGSRGSLILENKLEERIKQGLGREEAINKLYEEEIGDIKEGYKPLEEFLQSLEGWSGGFAFFYFLFYFLLIVITIIGAQAGVAFLILFGLIGFLSFPVVLLMLANTTANFEFKEEIRLENFASYLPDIKSLLPSVYQKVTLQKIFYSYNDDLEIRFKPDEKFDSEANRKIVKEFSIHVSFKTEKEDLILSVTYIGSVFRGGGTIASRFYRKVVLSFRASVNEAAERIKAEKAVKINFPEIIELIAKYGIIVKEIKCPVCGGKIDLPKEGRTAKCPYCGATIEAIDVYRIIKDLIRELP
ncbi:MAG: hypothetical protein ACP5IT_11740 [Thermoproteota archaeon]